MPRLVRGFVCEVQMSDFVNRTTLEYVRSGNDPFFPDPPWLLVPRGSPNETVCLNVPQQYRKILGDILSEMTPPEKLVVDQAARDAARDSTAAQLDRLEGLIRAFALAVLDEFNAHSAKINAVLDAADNATNMASFKTAMLAITDQPDRTISQMKTAVRNKLGS